MTTVGILGGGQLARMLALAGAPLGLRFLIMDTEADACAGQCAPLLVGDYRDPAALAEFASRVDVATFDFENVPAESAQWLSERIPVFPNPGALAIAQDRLAEKSLFRELGIPVPAFADVDSRAALAMAVAAIGTPCILKTRRLGYDGKGQFRIQPGTGSPTAETGCRSEQRSWREGRAAGAARKSGAGHGGAAAAPAGDLAAAVDASWASLGAQAGTVGLILEAFVPFERELSVVAVRGRNGEFRAWPLTENWHVDGVLSASLAPAGVDAALAETAFTHARALADRLDYVGVFALELFCRDGQLLANELAPRVHNSGHWSIEGAVTSQFENHLRAVLGLPLGATDALGPACMLNWIGALPAADPVLREPGGHWHDYGKLPRDGRKVGHATLRAASAADLRAALLRVGDALDRRAQLEPVIARLAGD
ncbi:MAG: 5-(carboxyamino)imidazole ribonucleotide synthase [Pseudomonadota bacterium]|nr:5-(carboxyamino)imidazole ribonucleotide synthase [Pseudomonadota bacterium]